jgi:Protein of unknown function (DUF4199)
MENHKNALINGLIWSGIAIATTLLLYLLGMIENPFASVLLFFFGLYMMYRSGIEKRNELGGFISWKLALTPIWLCSVVFSFFSNIFTWILFRFIAPELQEKQRAQAIEMTEKMRSMLGDAATEAELEKLEIQDFASISNYVYFFLISLLFYFILASLIALVVRKKDPKDLFEKY